MVAKGAVPLRTESCVAIMKVKLFLQIYDKVNDIMILLFIDTRNLSYARKLVPF